MRSIIICLISLLLVPSLVTSKRWSPPPSNSPSPPPRYSPSTPPLLFLPSPPVPDHGDFVRYRESHGSNVGIVVGSQTHPFGNINIAPLASHSAHPPRQPIIPLYNRVLTAHPGQVANTGHSWPDLATQVERQHGLDRPMVSRVSGAVHGSPIHQAMQVLHSSRYH